MHKQSLFHISKRDALPWYQAVLIRGGAIVLALIVCALYAASDEFHQCFSDGRGPSPIDVMIDTVGASIALLLRTAALRLRRLKEENPA